MTDVVVTGMGVLSPVGLDVPTLWQSHIEGRSGLRREERFDVTGVPCGFVGGTFTSEDVALLSDRWLTPNGSWQEALQRAAIEQALVDACLDSGAPGCAGRVAMVTARAGTGNSHDRQQAADREERSRRCVAETGLGRRSVIRFFQEEPVGTITDPAFYTSYAERLGDLVAVVALEATCSTGIRLIAEGARLIQTGRADCVVAAVSSSRIDEYLIGAYGQMMALSVWRDPPELACKPFDRRRTGMVPAEAAAAIVLESEQHARRRGAQLRGRLLGWGFVAGLDHPTKLDAGPISGAMQAALAHSGLSSSEIDAVNTHGTSTRINDLNEARAIHSTFGPRAYEMGIAACKSILGHSSVAAAMVESIVALKMIEHGVVPPVPTCIDPDPACDLPVSKHPVERPIRTVLKNAFGFGGQYGSVIYGPP